MCASTTVVNPCEIPQLTNTSTVPYKTVRQIFVVQGKLLADDRRNLSALADGLGVKRKQTVEELYNIVFKQE